MSGIDILLLLMFFGPLTVAVMADFVIDLCLLANRPRRLLAMCVENAFAVAAFYLFITLIFQWGLRGLAVVLIAALPKPALSGISLLLNRQMRGLPIQTLAVSVLTKFTAFAVMFASALWLAALD